MTSQSSDSFDGLDAIEAAPPEISGVAWDAIAVDARQKLKQGEPLDAWEQFMATPPEMGDGSELARAESEGIVQLTSSIEHGHGDPAEAFAEAERQLDSEVDRMYATRRALRRSRRLPLAARRPRCARPRRRRSNRSRAAARRGATRAGPDDGGGDDDPDGEPNPLNRRGHQAGSGARP